MSASKKKQVLMVGVEPNSKGGIASVIKMYDQAGLFQRIDYMASYTDGSMLRKGTFYAAFMVRYLFKLITNPSIKLVHIHTASYGSFLRKSLILMLAKLFGKKTVMHIHGSEFRLFHQKCPVLIRHVITRMLHSCDVIVALSSQWKNDLEHISAGNPNVRVIYNPTMIQKPIKGENGTPEKPVNFLFMGRLGQRKGVYDIIESAGQLRSPNVKISLYGDGEVEQARTIIHEKGLDETITVAGWISGEQKHATFCNANVLLLPSYNEGLPIAILEALAYGIPVVASNVGGIPEAVEDGVNGFLIQPGECEVLAKRIDELASSDELRQRMGASGYSMALRKFALSVVIGQLESLYDELIAA